MKIPYRIILAAVAASLILPLSAQAAKGDKKKNDKNPAATFAALDTDKNGSISQEEYVAGMKEKLGEDGAKTHFAELDKDHDGQLSKDELGAGDKKPAKGKKGKKNAV